MSHPTETELSVDVIVVGGGMSGASVAYEIADHRTVALLERESTLAFHTTGRSAATFIENYGNPVIRMLTAGSRDFFTDPPEGFDPPLATSLPLLTIADSAHTDALRESHHQAALLGCDTELVDGAVAEEINPYLRPGYTQLATVDLTPMELDVHGLHQGYVRGLRRRGGTIVKSAGIVSGARRHGRWALQDSSGRVFEAATVINAAGAWCDELARLLGARPVGIQPLRRTAFMASAPRPNATGSLPMTLDASDAFYFKPDGAQFLCSPADETPQPPGDPRPDELEMARAIGMINEATTLGIRSVNSAWAGLRSFTADRTPVVGADPGVEDFFWYAAQGGYGIQMAPALARTGAALATGAALPDDLAARGLTAAMLAPGRDSLHTGQ
ncbi:NAD(P)/FAD-dependent oxidoreductase [Mycobacteroides abscessus]|uniref:NAD(P)/FAD-dependent oxidoreductase n=1 Tax=Mycobacteroides abscessus TaxID=36809 RepID=UPI0005DB5C70|nr:FAD-dependent oxidoreductase [Mycobacteroides abscessus]CPS34746.1 Probable FAD dependent oxidoreductase [Mycobacteroides abscessus]CPS35080.1 Probable FAD dependent oxidoreductase [Mycobacteroides abscessus]CPS35811.1 Probable FAD dependent oxidoreductase [Mycobacteroides abscessus]CPT21650.1 Probable FAD dependent oxidoreductase [Mycobacteroides abscessus]CPT45541.1 Probable FAD dependent oxidoreductase [Mycobacteroides abscessus]